jgi:hypothetical protein
MRGAVFIFCLFYILLGGYNYLYSGRLAYASLRLEKSNVKFTDNKQGVSVVKVANPGEPGPNLIPDMEDEDPNDTTARRFKLLSRFLYALANSFILTILYNRFRSSKPYYSLFGFKYITQRVLRI